ncbi:MAG: hypothetical protein IT327_14325 [Anaerolineae bacterium]|nr:hypothetical protein [Anaerolineae bacterium]
MLKQTPAFTSEKLQPLDDISSMIFEVYPVVRVKISNKCHARARKIGPRKQEFVFGFNSRQVKELGIAGKMTMMAHAC